MLKRASTVLDDNTNILPQEPKKIISERNLTKHSTPNKKKAVAASNQPQSLLQTMKAPLTGKDTNSSSTAKGKKKRKKSLVTAAATA